MLFFVLRAAVTLFTWNMLGTGTASQVLTWCEAGVTAMWLTVEGYVLWDVLFRRRGVPYAQEASSQVLWSVAVAGHTVLAALTRTASSPLARCPSSFWGHLRGHLRGHFSVFPFPSLVRQTLLEAAALSPEIHSPVGRPNRVVGNFGQQVA